MQDNTNTNQHPLEEGEKEEEMTCSYSRGLQTDMGQSFFFYTRCPFPMQPNLKSHNGIEPSQRQVGVPISVPTLARTKATLTSAHTDA